MPKPDSVAARLKALEEAVAFQDAGAPAAYGVWHSALVAIRSEVESVAREMHGVIPGRSPIAIRVGGWAARLSEEGRAYLAACEEEKGEDVCFCGKVGCTDFALPSGTTGRDHTTRRPPQAPTAPALCQCCGWPPDRHASSCAFHPSKWSCTKCGTPAETGCNCYEPKAPTAPARTAGCCSCCDGKSAEELIEGVADRAKKRDIHGYAHDLSTALRLVRELRADCTKLAEHNDELLSQRLSYEAVLRSVKAERDALAARIERVKNFIAPIEPSRHSFRKAIHRILSGEEA